MARTKATEVKEAAVKEEAVKEAAPKKTTTRKTAAKKTETAVKDEEVKAAEADTVEVSEKASAKKAAPKKTAAKKAEAEATVTIQFQGKDIVAAELVEKAKEAFALISPEVEIKTVDIYVKPEEGVAYYAVNGQGSADYKIEL